MDFRDELGVADGIILKGMRIVVPPSLRQEMLTQIHETHLGIAKRTERAREALFWPGMTTDIENTVMIAQNVPHIKIDSRRSPKPQTDLGPKQEWTYLSLVGNTICSPLTITQNI